MILDMLSARGHHSPELLLGKSSQVILRHLVKALKSFSLSFFLPVTPSAPWGWGGERRSDEPLSHARSTNVLASSLSVGARVVTFAVPF